MYVRGDYSRMGEISWHICPKGEGGGQTCRAWALMRRDTGRKSVKFSS